VPTLAPALTPYVNGSERSSRPMDSGVSGASYTYEDIERLAAVAGVSVLDMLSLADAAANDATTQDRAEATTTKPRLVDWAQQNFYIPEAFIDGSWVPWMLPVVLEPHQVAILDYLFERPGADFWTTILWSTIKKSGKSAISAMVARYVMECYGSYPEVVLAANDAEQARGVVYKAIVHSLEITPGYDSSHKVLLDQSGATLWRVIERELQFLPNHGQARAISGDYAGEAGSNPNASFWTELWAYRKESSLRLWDELTPVATRKGSFRFIDTYAGHTNEKGTLWDLYQRVVIKGRQLYCHDIPAWPSQSLDRECNCGTELGCCADHNDAPGPNGRRERSEMGGLPLFVDHASSTFAYWDVGVRARRMPWQQGEAGKRYYQVEAASLRPNAYIRLHENGWTESAEAFIPIIWWDACKDERLRDDFEKFPNTLGIEDINEPCVLSADAAVSGDCCGLSLHTRHPERRNEGAVRAAWLWTPPPGGKFDYQQTIEQQIRFILQQCTNATDHEGCTHGPALLNVVELCYDEFQLHDMMTRLIRDGLCHCQQFGQGMPRAIADYQLRSAIQGKRISHPGSIPGYEAVSLGFDGLRDHLANANSKQKVDEDTRLRIIKKDPDQKIDLAVCISMGNFEITRLLIE
jgi:hypothetical protein